MIWSDSYHFQENILFLSQLCRIDMCRIDIDICHTGILKYMGNTLQIANTIGSMSIEYRSNYLGRELGPSGVSPNQNSRWKLAFSPLNMFNLRLCNAATIRYSLLKFGHMHLCGKDYKYFSPHCCKCNSFGCIAAIRCVNACHGPHSDSVYSGSEHRQFNSPRPVKREAGFPNPRRALIGSNQLWRVNDSPYYREYPCVCATWLHNSVMALTQFAHHWHILRGIHV